MIVVCLYCQAGGVPLPVIFVIAWIKDTGRESIKIGPPLTIPDDALIEGLGVLEGAITEIDREG